MDQKKAKNRDLLIGLGVGILVEGLILVTMLSIGSTEEAITSFLMMIFISFFMGCFIYMSALNHQNKDRKLRGQS